MRLVLEAVVVLCSLVFLCDCTDSWESILEEYKRTHNKDRVLKEEAKEFCARKFVIATYACPSMVGNHMHEFLNAWAGAVVTNRTVLWNFCNRKPCLMDDEETCGLYIERAAWIPSANEVEAKWKASKCDQDVAERVQIIGLRTRYAAEKIIACCGIDEISRPFIDYGGMDRREMMPLSFPGAKLNTHAKQIAQTLFAEGDDVGYGRLFRATFTFTPRVTEQNMRILQIAEDSLMSPGADRDNIFKLGIHLRHSSTRDVNGTMDYGEVGCLKKVLQEANPTGKKCILLVASDRAQTLTRMREAAIEIGCVFTTSNHSMIHQQYGEHGPFWGEIAMADIELLSHSDYFVGSSYHNFGAMTSTYSMLISGMVGSKKGEVKNYKDLYENAKHELEKLLASRRVLLDNGATDGISRSFAKWLPTCDISVGARYIPDPIYANSGKDFKCDSIGVSLPEICPHYKL